MDFFKVDKQMVANSVNIFVGLAELLLALRVVLKFFFTSAGGSFVHWGISTTDVLLAPFRGVFPDPSMAPATNWYVDWVALFAMALYMAAGVVLLGVVGKWAGRK